MIFVIMLILNDVNQLFQMVPGTHQRPFQMGCSPKIQSLIHFNPIRAAGGLTEMKHPQIQRKCQKLGAQLHVFTLVGSKYTVSDTSALLFVSQKNNSPGSGYWLD